MPPRRPRPTIDSRLELLRECGEESGLASWSKSFETPSERVLESLVRTFEPRARAIIGYHGIQPQDGDDLVQQTYLTFLQKHHEVEDPQAWLAGTLRNRCLMFWRSQRRGWLRLVDDAVLDSRPCGDPSPLERATTRCDLSRVLAGLPKRGRDLVRLRFGLGYDNREVAEFLGYRYSGIYTITKRFLATLAQELEAGGYTVEASLEGDGSAEEP